VENKSTDRLAQNQNNGSEWTVRVKIGWFRIRIMGQSGATCLPVTFQWANAKNNSVCWSWTKRTSFHPRV